MYKYFGYKYIKKKQAEQTHTGTDTYTNCVPNFILLFHNVLYYK